MPTSHRIATVAYSKALRALKKKIASGELDLKKCTCVREINDHGVNCPISKALQIVYCEEHKKLLDFIENEGPDSTENVKIDKYLGM